MLMLFQPLLTALSGAALGGGRVGGSVSCDRDASDQRVYRPRDLRDLIEQRPPTLRLTPDTASSSFARVAAA